MNPKIGILVFASSACVHSAVASTITEYNRNTFQTALTNQTVSGQNFDSLPVGTITTVNGVTYTASLGTAYVTNAYLTTTGSNGLGSTSIGYFKSNETLTLTFATPITAFALDINTFATNNGDYTATVNDGSGSVVPSIFDVFPNRQTGEFIGFTDSSAFTTVTIADVTDPGSGGANCTAGACSYTVDTLVYGSASAIASSTTPEPSAFILLGTGLLAVASAARRRLL